MSNENETEKDFSGWWVLRGIGILLLVLFFAGGLALAYAFGMTQGLGGINPLPFAPAALALPLLCLAPLFLCGFFMAMRMIFRPFGHRHFGPFGHGPYWGHGYGRWGKPWKNVRIEIDDDFPIPPMVEELHTRLHKIADEKK